MPGSNDRETVGMRRGVVRPSFVLCWRGWPDRKFIPTVYSTASASWGRRELVSVTLYYVEHISLGSVGLGDMNQRGRAGVLRGGLYDELNGPRLQKPTVVCMRRLAVAYLAREVLPSASATIEILVRFAGGSMSGKP